MSWCCPGAAFCSPCRLAVRSTARAASLLDDLRSGAKPLRVGTDATFPPFEQTSPDGTKTGFDIDLVNAIAKHAGIKTTTFQQVPFGQLVPGLQADHIDLAASAIYITPERAKVIDFSQPYFSGGLAVMVKPNETGITKPEDLDGKTIAVQVGDQVRRLPASVFSQSHAAHRADQRPDVPIAAEWSGGRRRHRLSRRQILH